MAGMLRCLTKAARFKAVGRVNRSLLSSSKSRFLIKSFCNIRVQTRLASSVGYRIHPAIGISRVGDAEAYYDEPITFGGLPTDPVTGEKVSSFRSEEDTDEKDDDGEIVREKKLTRQAAVFKIHDENGTLIDMDLVDDIKWSVWLANKKAGFYGFEELKGYPLLAQFQSDSELKVNANGYIEQNVAKRNASVSDSVRQGLIIDFGPQSVSHSVASSAGDKIDKKEFNENGSTLNGYSKASWPSKFLEGMASLEGTGNGIVDTLGHVETNDKGELRVLGAYGKACGLGDLNSFAGGDLWWDDISDGPVRAEITFKDTNTEAITLTAWCMVGSPKYAPELVNISTMDDVIYDAAIRYNAEFRTEYFVKEDGAYDLGANGFKPIFERDIKPILDRMKNYAWVANVAAMVAFANPPFNVYETNPSEEEIDKRKRWFRLLRRAFPLRRKCLDWPLAESHASRQHLFSEQDPTSRGLDMHFPLMPLNSGDNSVMDNQQDDDGEEGADHQDQIISKFTTLTPTQYYMLYQWTRGHIGTSESDAQSLLCQSSYKLNSVDRATVGNCVGYPTSPGIETAWNVRVPWIYDQENDPYRLVFNTSLFENLIDTGLDPLRDECRYQIRREKAETSTDPKIAQDYGLEPGDLTKRMAIPWQADFSNCSVQSVNFTDKSVVRPDNKPAYYTYWWPPQAPWNVYLGYEDKEDQEDVSWGMYGELGSGQQVMYQRGIMNQTDVYKAMIEHWKDLGFIKNESNNDELPYFTENERLVHKFITNYGQGGVPTSK